ncbi:MAG: TM2 domain-containing protein [Flavobacteriaceae bacterium]|nr:TM2 domain-containing protein [Flavobacteriaceae bacterium]
MDNKFYNMYSGFGYEEAMLVENIIQNLTDEEKQKFLLLYSSQRQDETTMLVCILLGFIGIGGVHRFVIGDIGLGILYLLTAGLCYIGTIIDLVNYKNITLSYNRRKMKEVAMMMNLNIGMM